MTEIHTKTTDELLERYTAEWSQEEISKSKNPSRRELLKDIAENAMIQYETNREPKMTLKLDATGNIAEFVVRGK